MGNYKINMEKDKKEVAIFVEGQLTEVQAANFISEYQNKVNSVTASDFVCNIDCRTLDVVTKELVPALQQCFHLYKSSGFKDVVFVLSPSNSKIVKMQLLRISKECGLDAKFKIV